VNPHRPDWERFFDDLADRWEEVAAHDPAKLDELVALLRLAPGERVLDVGTGLGVLVPRLLASVGPAGEVVACDLSSRMIARARERHRAANLRFVHAAAETLEPGSAGIFDALVCYSVAPHFADIPHALERLCALLAPGGRLAVLHSQSRAAINGCHRGAGGPVADDLLPPAAELAALLRGLGLTVTVEIDDDRLYAVVARRPAPA